MKFGEATPSTGSGEWKKKSSHTPKICRHAATFPGSPWGAWPRALRIKRNGAATLGPRSATGSVALQPSYPQRCRHTGGLGGHGLGGFVAALRIKCPPCALFRTKCAKSESDSSGNFFRANPKIRNAGSLCSVELSWRINWLFIKHMHFFTVYFLLAGMKRYLYSMFKDTLIRLISGEVSLYSTESNKRVK